MTEAMPFLQKAILLSYDPRPYARERFCFPALAPKRGAVQPLQMREPLCGG